MKQNETESKKIRKNSGESTKLYQVSKTPMTADMIYEAVRKEFPKMFSDDAELVKLIGGDMPVFETQREMSK